MKNDLVRLTTKLQSAPKFLERKLPLGWFQCEALYALESLRADAYGVSIALFLDKKMSRKNNVGQVYATLKDLMRLKYIRERKIQSPHGKGRDVATYRITPLGYAAVRATLIMVDAAEKMKDADS